MRYKLKRQHGMVKRSMKLYNDMMEGNGMSRSPLEDSRKEDSPLEDSPLEDSPLEDSPERRFR